MFADVGPQVSVRADVLPQHAGLLAADAALATHVLPSASTPHVHVVLIRLVPEGGRGTGTGDRGGGREGKGGGEIEGRGGERKREGEGGDGGRGGGG